MGIKSTVFLSRSQAEERYLQLKVELKRAKWLKQAQALSNGQLEVKLEELNDQRAGKGLGGFENYCID